MEKKYQLKGIFIILLYNGALDKGHLLIEAIKKRLFFSSYRTGLNGPGYYTIPYRTTEVFLTCRVLIPKYKSIEKWESNREYFYTEPQTIKWTMTWPE
jgi:hypothetical protein